MSSLCLVSLGWSDEVGAAVQRGPGGRPYLLQQVPREELRQGPVPHQDARAPLPCAQDQQNVVVRAGADRLQTGMRGAFGKAHGTAARVRIGQILISVRSHDKFKAECVEALRRSKFKFSGRQKIFVSKKFGFTKWNRDDYNEMREDGRLKLDGVNVK